ncbi:bifunctional 3-(3-hydroxy-phenyl)propionate/3-hydroxycinnamic acid hydroxylase [Streptomyces sp. Go40/10]|uniref:bifunctional 3-(3-hydroxy-phenyl)propionate/3-hydroxycinnamic acid hydroxylase MhpA n=1 Tax=Streptomyces sp. Go40/10 TaxID=2825844 RepID=UPI001E3466EE|nr:bifunctional 3-(3-hydroxy-phenyl)propionate/3-hydroxycinnamic acid hydroxylase [Streptomyces sp. Go40/10]UFR00897.1 bifunctional 3-(3-hydroxy-phenyl)propionate/3-hydroxycinnamic acid hydroxylase [Streptomyces sp. Go40/10]
MSAVPPNGTRTSASSPDTDVLVVGYGPVGSVLAVLLAQRGWRVTVLERRRRPYTLPRATSFDGETARLLAGTGVGGELGRITEPGTGYQWRTADGETLLDIEFTTEGPYGWPDANTMHQPALEELLAARAAELPGITVLRDRRVVDLADGPDGVTVTAEDEEGATRTFSARWVVGCDGANSFVRERMGVSVTDLGFSYEWLLCDVELREPREFVPTNVQLCDPARPTTLVGSGPGHRRWEFMRLPGERAADLNREETAWRLLAPYGVTPDTARLLRSTTYIFQARWADEWRAGHVLLAGDAAHLMPPFAGQGMCSGVRDVVGLAWRLDLVLRGTAPESLLDSYTEERRAQVRESILASVQLGRLICVTDAAAAAERDATVLANRRGRGPGRPDPARPITCGLLHRPDGTDTRVTPTGEVLPHARLLGPSGAQPLEDPVRGGFVLFTKAEAETGLTPDRLSFLRDVGARVVRLWPAGGAYDGTGGAVEAVEAVDALDADGVLRAWLDRYGATALLVRPDYHVFGTATGPDGTALLVDDLRTRLTTPAPAPAGRTF